MQEYFASVKVVLLGESSVGKSTIVTRFTTGEFYQNNATIGAAFTTKEVEWSEVVNEEEVKKKVKFEIWDTAGQERYRSLAPMYYRNTDVALIVFDVTDNASADRAESWIQELQGYLDEYQKEKILIRIVGNKIDLCHPEQANVLNGATLVSAKTGEGINSLFMSIAMSIDFDRFVNTQLPSKDITASNRTINLGQNSYQRVREGCNC